MGIYTVIVCGSVWTRGYGTLMQAQEQEQLAERICGPAKLYWEADK